MRNGVILPIEFESNRNGIESNGNGIESNGNGIESNTIEIYVSRLVDLTLNRI